jgi:4-hydroxy-3-methylbut-2-enyl diphosphate reductase
MRVRIAKSSGFCFGVKRAFEIALREAKMTESGSVFTDGPLIHNPQALKLLRNQGIKLLEEIKRNNIKGTIIIRSHGVSPERRNELEKTGARIVDATCPKVKKVQSVIDQYARKGFYVVIIGDKSHAEVKGLLGHANEKGIAIQTECDLKKLPSPAKFCVVAQTTQSRERFTLLSEKIKKRFPGALIFDTICETNRNRQEELKNLCNLVDAVIVVGGKESANTKRLVEIAKSKGKPTFFVESEDELVLDKLKNFKEVGIIGGASTPDWVLSRILSKLEKLENNNN